MIRKFLTDANAVWGWDEDRQKGHWEYPGQPGRRGPSNWILEDAFCFKWTEITNPHFKYLEVSEGL